LQSSFLPFSASAASRNYSAGTLIIPMDTVYQNMGMWRAYGLVFELLSKDIPVAWAISPEKNFNGIDFNANTRDLRTDANVGAYNYSGGPFIIDSLYETQATKVIQDWWARYPGLPNVHRATSSFVANIDIVLKTPPLIASEAINSGIAINYFNAAGIPDLNGKPWTSTSPNILNQTMIANGALFLDGVCSRRAFDIFVTPHNGGYSYSLTDPNNLGTRTYAQLDSFVDQGGGWVALCHSILSNENAIMNLYKNSSPTVRSMFLSDVNGGFLTYNGFGAIANKAGIYNVTRPDLPLAQAVSTIVAQALPGGSVQTWDRTSVSYYPETEKVASFSELSTGKIYDHVIAGVAHNGDSLGKITYIGGHSYSTSLPYSNNYEAPYLRFFYNSLFFNGAAVAKLDLDVSTESIPLGLPSNLTLTLMNTGASIAENTNEVSIKLAPGVSYVNTLSGPVPISITGDPSVGTTLTWGSALGDISGGVEALKIQVSLTPTALGELKIGHLFAKYGDVFGENFTADLCREIKVHQPAKPVISKTAANSTIYPGQLVEFDINYGNETSIDLINSTIEDILPVGLVYSSASPTPRSVTPLPDGTTRIIWDVGTVASGSLNNIINLKVFGGKDIVTYTNRAILKGYDWTGYKYEVEDTAVVNVVLPPISLNKSVVPEGPIDVTNPGQILTYSLRPYYGGSNLLSDVLVSDPIPAYSTYVAGSVSSGGLYGFNRLPAINGVDTSTFVSPRSTTLAFTTSPTPPSSVVDNSTISISFTITNNSGQTISNIYPSLTERLGGAVVNGPSQSVPVTLANGASTTFTYSALMTELGERRFVASAEGTLTEPGDYSFEEALSATILVNHRLNATPANDLVTWRLGSNVDGDNGENIISGYPSGIYAFRGGNTREFSKYSIENNNWISKSQPTNGIEKGGALTTNNAGLLYASEGNSRIFYKYDINVPAGGTGTWTQLAQAPANFNEGGSIQFLKVGGIDYVYATLGNSKLFYRYNVATNNWTRLADTPENIKKGGDLATDGTYIYTLRGDRKTDFYRYNIATNTWTAMAPAPGNVGWGGALTRIGDFIYAFQGDGKTLFWRYSISGNTWTAMAPAPGNVGDGGSLTNDGINIYAIQGKTRNAWKYTVATNTWSTITSPNFTGNVGQGGSLVYDSGQPGDSISTRLVTNAGLVTNDDIITITLEVSSTVNINDITVPGNLTVTGTNGATASLQTGPILKSPDNNISGVGDVVTYEWTYKAVSGTVPGSSVTFSASPVGTGTIYTIPTAKSRSVLVSPVLTYQVKVFDAAALPDDINQILNQGMIGDQAVLGIGYLSNAVTNPLRRPILIIDKVNSPTGTVNPGQEIEYTIRVKNEGIGTAQNILISDIIPEYTSYVAGSAKITGSTTVMDDPLRTLTVIEPATELDPLKFQTNKLEFDETLTIRFKVVAETTLPAGTYEIANMAVVTASNVNTPIYSNVVYNYLTFEPAIDIVKSAEPDYIEVIGEVVNYEITVTNIGNVPLTNVVLSDPMLTDLAYVEGDMNNNFILDLGEMWIYTGTYIITEDDVDIGGYGILSNTATVTTNETGPKSSTYDVEIVIKDAILRITKEVNGISSSDATFTIRISNPDKGFVTDVTIKDGETVNLFVPIGVYSIFETTIPIEYSFNSAVVTRYYKSLPVDTFVIGSENLLTVNALEMHVLIKNDFSHTTYFHSSKNVVNTFRN
jgi:uncharacterized repeat protein (TIGR01451 family)